MDLELTDEQRWLSESVETLLDREWPAVDGVAAASVERRRRVWEQLVEFGALSIGGEQGIGAVEACLIAHALGAHLAAVPFIASAAVRLALTPASSGELVGGDTALALALLEPGSSWSIDVPDTELRRTRGGFVLVGEKVAVEQLDLADELAVLAALDGEPVLVVVSASHARIVVESRDSFDAMLPMSSVVFGETPVAADAALSGAAARATRERLSTAGSLLAAAEALGAASAILDQACRYAGERRQFGRTIGSFQSLRHILADMYVRSASGWSAVLYAAAEFDDGAAEAAQTASIAKAYVARGAREVAHGAMQVFGGIAFTAEHPAHRFLRRIIVREQQFGDAGHHERELGRRLVATSRQNSGRPGGGVERMSTSFTDPTAQRLEPIVTGAEPEVVGPHLAEVLHDSRWRECRVALIAGGKSNLTYRVASDAGEVVLRRPPLGHVLPTAHDMVREYRVQAALEPTPVPVPRMLHLGDGEGVLGASFYVMERVVGHICRNELPASYGDTVEQREAIGRALVTTLARLHAVAPAEIGLADFGRPAGFMERQLRRWSGQWQRSKVSDLPALDALRDELVRTLPANCRSSIVHGDYRLDNAILHATKPGEIVAVLDWEMSTLGDPFADLGAFLTYWSEEDDDEILIAARMMPPVTAASGFPSRDEIVEAYATITGFDVSDLAWYRAFAYFKLAVICQGIAARAQGGSMLGSGFDQAQGLVEPLIRAGRHVLAIT